MVFYLATDSTPIDSTHISSGTDTHTEPAFLSVILTKLATPLLDTACEVCVPRQGLVFHFTYDILLDRPCLQFLHLTVPLFQDNFLACCHTQFCMLVDVDIGFAVFHLPKPLFKSVIIPSTTSTVSTLDFKTTNSKQDLSNICCEGVTGFANLK